MRNLSNRPNPAQNLNDEDSRDGLSLSESQEIHYIHNEVINHERYEILIQSLLDGFLF